MTLAEFIAARLDDDETAIKDEDRADGMRRQLAAMRAILALHTPELRQLNNPFAGTTRVEYEASCPVCECEWPCPEVRIVTAIWADHPDYQQEWKPGPS